MNNVEGRVVVRPSSVGVPHLLVTLFDMNPCKGHYEISEEGAQERDERRWWRLGSTVTDNRGAFDLAYGGDGTYDDAGKSGYREPRPDLALVISAPEDSCTPTTREDSYTSDRKQHARIATCIRRNASRVESFPFL